MRWEVFVSGRDSGGHGKGVLVGGQVRVDSPPLFISFCTQSLRLSRLAGVSPSDTTVNFYRYYITALSYRLIFRVRTMIEKIHYCRHIYTRIRKKKTGFLISDLTLIINRVVTLKSTKTECRNPKDITDL